MGGLFRILEPSLTNAQRGRSTGMDNLQSTRSAGVGNDRGARLFVGVLRATRRTSIP